MGTTTSTNVSQQQMNKLTETKRNEKHYGPGSQYKQKSAGPTQNSKQYDMPAKLKSGIGSSSKVMRHAKTVSDNVSRNKRFKLTEHHTKSGVSKKQSKPGEKENATDIVQTKSDNNYLRNTTGDTKNLIGKIDQKKHTERQTSIGSSAKQITLKGAQLGNFTDIYLRPCDTGNLEIKEYPPVKMTGMVLIADNKSIVIDELKKLVTYTARVDGEYGKFGTWVEFKSAPRGICRLGESLFIAFADRTVKQLSLAEKLCVENSFFMEYKCSGITVYKKNLAIGLENGKIGIVDTKGKCLRKIDLPRQHEKQCIPRSLSETPDGNILFCDSNNDTVMCIKDDGSVAFTYRGMGNPTCAIYDPFKNIIVVGTEDDAGGAITLLTDRGNKVKVLKYRKEIGMQPYCITYVKDRKKLAMCGDSNKIQLYNIEKCNPRTKRELARRAEK